ncbi:hypothetical protein J6R97_04085 [bacterium]|nr:hypothetical protein [bacterium]
MNINSQPISLVRKNLMNTDSTVTNPEKLGLRLLSDSNESDTFTKSSENQENNVAFKGFLSAIPQKAKSFVRVFALAVPLAVAPLMQSCEEPLINIEQTTVVDLRNMEEMQARMNALLEQLVAQGALNNQTQEEIKNLIELWMAQYNQDQLTEQELLDKIKDLLSENNEISNAILNQLIANGLSQEEANAKLQAILDKLENGELTAQQAINQILALLANIDATLTDILERFDIVIEKLDSMNENMNEQTEYWNTALAYMSNMSGVLSNIRDNQQATNAYLDAIRNDMYTVKTNQTLSNNYLQILVQKADQIEVAIREIENGGSLTKEELLEALEQTDARRADELREFLAEYGVDTSTIPEIMNLLRAEIQDRIDNAARLDRIIALEAQILDFLQNGQLDRDNDQAKLDRIIELLNQFISSGGSNEGVIEDLEDLFS